MRITGGVWRSRRLRGPAKDSTVRPTPDSMRERAFAVLGGWVAGARFLDLFAGTGAVGLEALSRGAAAAVFVERHRGTAGVLRANCATFELGEDRARVVVQPAAAAVAALVRRGECFDLAWADPPFGSWEEGLDALTEAFAAGLLAPAAVACLECPERAVVEGLLPDYLEVFRDLKGGASRVLLIRRFNVER
jgi:16S rRNA (guanine966-N2)-methyltransferase